MPTPAVVTGTGRAWPPARDQDELWEGFFAAHYGGQRWARRVFASAGVSRRHCAIDPTTEDVSAWSTGRRMGRYAEEAVPLAAGAVTAALGAAGVEASAVGLMAVVSCTGYVTPGVDLRLAEQLGFPDSLQRLSIGHMGCYGALPGLGAVADYAMARRRPAVLVCVELSSLHLRPPSAESDQILAHALFGDAAAALVVEPAGPALPPGLELVEVASLTDSSAADLMTWEVTDLGFRMGLSRRVPDVLARHVAGVVDGLLARHGLSRPEVAGWAVHPGGPRILDVIADRLGLTASDLAESRQMLDQHGNCSSGTVLLILAELRRRRLPAGAPLVALAFGPGLTLYAALFRQT